MISILLVKGSIQQVMKLYHSCSLGSGDPLTAYPGRRLCRLACARCHDARAGWLWTLWLKRDLLRSSHRCQTALPLRMDVQACFVLFC